MTIIYKNAEAALQGVLRDNMVIMSGGFGLCGNPENLIKAIYDSKVTGLTLISNNCGTDEEGLGILLKSRQVKKMIASYVGENKNFEQQSLSGEIELELNPQGTLAERIRAAGAGIPAFFTPTGYGTVVAQGKEVREFDGKKYIMECALRADLAIIKGFKADRAGNIIYNKTARNFNPVMATAATITIAEVEEIVEDGELDPNNIHTPCVYVQRLIQGSNYRKPIEKLTVRERI